MNVKLAIDPRKAPDGVILVWHIQYDRQEGGSADPLTYTYVMLKAGGLWYVTGAGRVPVAAGWGAVEKWLGRDGRQPVRVELVTGQRTIWPEPVSADERDHAGLGLPCSVCEGACEIEIDQSKH